MTRSSSGRNQPNTLVSAGRTLLMKVVTTFYRRMVLVERDLFPPPPEPNLPFRVDIRSLEPPQDLADLRGFRPSLSIRSILDRLGRGDSCFGVWLDGRIVHAAWVAIGRARVDYLSRDMVLDRDEIYVFDSYTSSEFRGLHLAQARGAFLSSYYSRLGFRRSLGLVAVENEAGLAVPEALGYRRVGYYSAFGVGRWRCTWSEPLLDERIPPLVNMT